MIRRSRAMIVLCTGVALAVHAAGLWVSETPPRIEIAGGAGDVEAMLGSSFADMVAGAAQPVSDSTVAPRRQSDQEVDPTGSGAALRPETPDTAQVTPPPPRRTRADTPPRAAPARPAEMPPLTPSEAKRTKALAPAPSAAAVAAVLPEVTSDRAQDIRFARKPDASAADRPEAPRAPAPRKRALGADPDGRHGVQVSPRPQSRPRVFEQAAAARQSSEPDREAEVRGASGSNADRDANRGSTDGVKTATAPRQGRETSSRSTEPGNAATSNYPGEVMRHLARVPRPRATGRGAALVQFSVADGGRLASARLARSSGSTRLDRAALTVVRRAAPFPAPPRGAQRNFSVKIEGR
jgi:protein TonB